MDDETPYEDRPTPPRRRPSPAARAARENLGILVIVVVVIIGTLIFWVQNREKVSVQYLSVSVTAPLWLTVLAYLVLGIILGALIMYWRRGHR